GTALHTAITAPTRRLHSRWLAWSPPAGLRRGWLHRGRRARLSGGGVGTKGTGGGGPGDVRGDRRRGGGDGGAAAVGGGGGGGAAGPLGARPLAALLSAQLP